MGPLDRPDRSCWLWARGLLLLAVTAVYLQSGRFEFIPLDDNIYITANPVVLKGLTWEGLAYAFSLHSHWQYHPLAFLSHMIDVQLFGTWSGGHHLVNVAWHLGNTWLLLLLLRRITQSEALSWTLAAFWALHPLRVESVAWACERKDVLSTFLGLATILTYLRYAAAPTRAGYASVVVVFVMGLLAKPMLVTFPVVMLALDYWPLRRWPPQPGSGAGSVRTAAKLFMEKVPLLAISLLASLATIVAARHKEGLIGLDQWSLTLRLQTVLTSYASYIKMLFWPVDLGVIYPLPTYRHWGVYLASAATVLLMSLLAWKWRLSRPWFLVGWVWYLVTLLPVSGLMQSGPQAAADRFTYIPHIGLMLASGMLAQEWLKRLKPSPRLVQAGVLALLTLLACMSYVQTSYWRNGETLFRRTLDVTQSNAAMHVHYAGLMRDTGRPGPALRHFNMALSIDDDPQHHSMLGSHLCRMGRLHEGMAHLRLAGKHRKQDYTIPAALAEASLDTGQAAAAVDEARKSIALKDDYAPARLTLGKALLALGQAEQAAEQLQLALKLDPRHPGVRTELAEALVQSGQHAAAAAVLAQQWNLKPTAELGMQRAVLLLQLRQAEPAAQQLEAVLALDPRFMPAALLLSRVLATTDQLTLRSPERARHWAQHACDLTGGKHAGALEALAAAEAELGHFELAAQAQRKAIAAAEAAGQSVPEAMRQRLELYLERSTRGKP